MPGGGGLRAVGAAAEASGGRCGGERLGVLHRRDWVDQRKAAGGAATVVSKGMLGVYFSERLDNL